MDPNTAPEAKADAEKEFKELGRELFLRDLSAGFQLRKLSPGQTQPLKGAGGSSAGSVETLMKLRDMLIEMEEPVTEEAEAPPKELCPVF